MDALWDSLVYASRQWLVLSFVFAVIGFWLRRADFFKDARRKADEHRLNIAYHVFDLIVVAPPLILVSDAVSSALVAAGLTLPSALYTGWPALAVIVAAVAAGDFFGYWRHRLMHTRTLWPAHAIHHSDREMTWLALSRFHPVNRLITMVANVAVMTAAGFPIWAIAIASVVRQYYGYWVHADFPWDYGPLKRVFVSPVMHRWHHTRDEDLANRNFASVFALYDWMFGTLYLPGHKPDALGVEDPELPSDLVGQLLYPFKVWGRRLRPARRLPVI